MEIEPNPRSALIVSALAAGDFVDVRFNAFPDTGWYGSVVHASSERLRLVAHGATGRITESARLDSECLGYDLIIPMTSIAWIKHELGKPVGCECREGF